MTDSAQTPRYTLSDILNGVSNIVYSIRDPYNNRFVWVESELLSICDKKHLYLELAEKDDNNNLTAYCKANIWFDDRYRIERKFKAVTGKYLEKGMKVLLLCEPTFHPVYSFSLRVYDIDPKYTLGDIVRQKELTILRLKNEGLLDLNKSCGRPVVPQRIAIVSAAGAAGYQDMIDQLNNNQFGFKYYHALFDSLMQGQTAPKKMIEALDKIEKHRECFDLAVIVRGGGSDIDLSAFDDYELSKKIAQMSLPVIVGVGHTKDVSVADIVAYESVKTPTAAAEKIIEWTNEYNKILKEHQNKISKVFSQRLIDETETLADYRSDIRNSVVRKMEQEISKLNSYETSLKMVRSKIQNEEQSLSYKQDLIYNKVKKRIENEFSSLDKSELKIKAASPESILERGYTLTMKNGKIVHLTDLKEGDVIETLSSEGKVKSTVQNITINKSTTN